MTIHRGLFLGTPVAEKVIELLQSRFVIAPVALEGDGEVFAGMGMMEGERAGLVECSRVSDGSGSSKKQQSCEAGAIAGGLRTERFDLAREDSQHY